MSGAFISVERLKTILKRQSSNAWGKDYEPAIKATVREAPRKSRPSTLIWEKIHREIHLLSPAERAAALLAMYHPRLLDINEQRMLHTTPFVHPLHGHPLSAGMELPAFEGTVKVCERLGCLRRHSMVFFSPSGGPAERVKIPFPFFGDLLLFMLDESGSPYCLNWTVKEKAEGFTRQDLSLRLDSTREAKSRQKAEQRHEIEEIYYYDAGIRTYRVTKDDIDVHLRANLEELFLWHARKLAIDAEQRLEMLCYIKELIGVNTPFFSVLDDMKKTFNCAQHDCLGVLYQGIWRQQLRVDLFQPILMDRPLRTEKVDALKKYSHLFRR